MKKALIKVFFLLAIVMLNQNALATDRSITSKLTDALRGSNTEEILSLINDAKGLSYQEEIIPFMYGLWKGEELPVGISPVLIKKDIIRINIADFLVQAAKNGLVEIDEKELQLFAQKVLSSGDTEAISSALFVLAHIDDPNDVNRIEIFIFYKSDFLFRSATLSLAMMCNKLAEKSLEKLERKVSDSRREYLIESREKFRSMKQKGFNCH